MIDDPGLALAIGLAILVAVPTWIVDLCIRACADGRIRVNRVIGIRLRQVMASESAWRTGHLAASHGTRPAAITITALLACSVPLHVFPSTYIVLLGVAVVAIPLTTVASAVRAVRAVQTRPRRD